MTPDMQTVIRTKLPIDIRMSLGILRHGALDPTVRLGASSAVFAHDTDGGPVTVRVSPDPSGTRVQAWGPGATCTMDNASALVGGDDCLDDWRPGAYRLVKEMDRIQRGLRYIRTNRVMDALVPAVLEQKVTATEAYRSWSRLVHHFRRPAPGHFGLLLAPRPEDLRTLAYHDMHRLGVGRRRSDVIRRLSERAFRVEEATRLPQSQRRSRLEAFSGVGVWTSAETAQAAWADADAVSVGDYHLCKVVVHALTGLRGGDDDAMMELLEPLRPHRGRAARLLMMSGLGPEPRGPKHRLRDIRAI